MSAYTAQSDEMGLIGACLIGSLDTANDALAAIRPSMLISDDAQETLELIDSLARESKQPTIEAIARAWRGRHGVRIAPMAFWSSCMDACPSEANLGMHVAGITEAHVRRTLRHAADNLAQQSGDPSVPVDAALANLEAGIAIHESNAPAIESSRQVLVAFSDDLQARRARQGQLSGITSGIGLLDRMTDGFQPGEMAVIGARPSIGKTAFAINIVEAACIYGGVPTLIVSHEMANRSLMRRMVASLASVPIGDLKSGNVDDAAFRRMTAASAKIQSAPAYWVDCSRGATVETVSAAVRRAVRKHGVRLVIVDYIQKIETTKSLEKRTYEVAHISSRLKSCAQDTGVALVALAQVNRDSEKEKGRMPRLNDLSDSSQIEKDADLAMLLHRDRSEAEGDACLIVAKQRDGECGMVPMRYEGRFCRFSNPTKERPT